MYESWCVLSRCLGHLVTTKGKNSFNNVIVVNETVGAVHDYRCTGAFLEKYISILLVQLLDRRITGLVILKNELHGFTRRFPIQ